MCWADGGGDGGGEAVCGTRYATLRLPCAQLGAACAALVGALAHVLPPPSPAPRSRADWTPPPLKATSGTLYKFIKNVSSASTGCVTDA